MDRIYLYREDLKNKPKKRDMKPWKIEALIWSGKKSEIDTYHTWQEFRPIKKRRKK